MKPLIAIGLGTRDRPEMLREALKSLTCIHLPDEMDALLIVCDNGSTDESIQVAQDFESKIAFEVLYLKEEQQGIVYMRNRILEKAIEESATYLAFFDDDEKVGKDWLVQLNRARIKYSAHVVQGSLSQSFPEVKDLEIIKEVFPGDFKRSSGDELEEAYTNNVLLDLELVKDHNLRFNQRFNLTGGSDSYFFREMKKRGARIIYCEEALVTEIIPESRASIEWILSRYYRNGYTMYLMNLESNGRLKASWLAIKYIYKSIKTFLDLAISQRKPLDKTKMQKLNRYLRAKGVFHAMLGVSFEEYKSIHGG